MSIMSTNVLITRQGNICYANERNRETVLGTDLSHAAPSAQGAAGLAEVIIVPARQRRARSLDAVEVVQAAVVGELSERWKTAGERDKDEGDVLKRQKTSRGKIEKQCQERMRYV